MTEKQMRKTRLYDRDQTIALINPENPRRNGSNRAAIFDVIRDGMTVDEFLHAVQELKGGTKDLQILEQSGHLEVLPPEETSQEQEVHASY